MKRLSWISTAPSTEPDEVDELQEERGLCQRPRSPFLAVQYDRDEREQGHTYASIEEVE